MAESGDFLIPKKEGAIGDDPRRRDRGGPERSRAGPALPRRGRCSWESRSRISPRRIGSMARALGKGLLVDFGDRVAYGHTRCNTRREGTHRRFRDPHAARPVGRRRRKRSGSSSNVSARSARSTARGRERHGALSGGAKGVYTASAGNMAQGVAWNARRLGVPCSVPEHAPQTKIAAVEAAGSVHCSIAVRRLVERDHRAPPPASTVSSSIRSAMRRSSPEMERSDSRSSKICPEVPFGAGLSCGIGTAIRALSPGVKILAAEVATARPLDRHSAAGRPGRSTTRELRGRDRRHQRVEEMWPLASSLLDGSCVVSPSRSCQAIGFSWSSAIASSPRAQAPQRRGRALPGKAGGGKIVCVVSGGTFDAAKLAAILSGDVP